MFTPGQRVAHKSSGWTGTVLEVTNYTYKSQSCRIQWDTVKWPESHSERSLIAA